MMNLGYEMVENIILMFGNDIKDKENTINLIQKCIPSILENECYLERYIGYLSNKYAFEAQKEYLRRKLNSFLKGSFRDDPVRLAQRLVRGKYKDKAKEKWIWISSYEAAMIANAVVDN